MCNLYNLKVARWELQAYYQANDDFRREIELDELAKDYVSKATPGLVVRQVDGQRLLSEPLHWGWPNPRPGQDEVRNVRNYSSPFWRSALVNPERRCLVPFTQFQEWTVEPDPETGKKRPHWFSLLNRPIGTFAGIWRPSEKGDIFTFLTCGYSESPRDSDDERAAAASHIVGKIHPKAMPVILHEEDFDKWLTAPVDDALTLACAHPSQLIVVD
jgi:putative SOS response-associated peptidase YedK